MKRGQLLLGGSEFRELGFESFGLRGELLELSFSGRGVRAPGGEKSDKGGEFGLFRGERRFEGLKFAAALGFELGLRLLGIAFELGQFGETRLGGGDVFLKGGELLLGAGGVGGSLGLGGAVDAFEGFLRGGEVGLGFGDEGAGGVELAFEVAEVAALLVELGGLAFRGFGLGAELLGIGFDAAKARLGLGELFFADFEGGLEAAQFVAAALLDLGLDFEGVALLAELVDLLAEVGGLLRGGGIGLGNEGRRRQRGVGRGWG